MTKDFDWSSSSHSNSPLFIGAQFGMERGKYSKVMSTDATDILRFLLIKGNNKRLVLSKPVSGPHYWYTYLFGAPSVGKRNSLWIEIRLEGGTTSTQIFRFDEDTQINVQLRAGPTEELSLQNQDDFWQHVMERR
jgi:hypothetical protein